MKSLLKILFDEPRSNLDARMRVTTRAGISKLRPGYNKVTQ